MPYFNSINLLFIHIPKNAGGSITKALDDYCVQNYPSAKTHKQKVTENKFLGIDDIYRHSGLFGHVNFRLCLQHLSYAEIETLNLIPKDELKLASTLAIVRNPYERIVSSYFSHRRYENHASFESFCENWIGKKQYRTHEEFAHARPQVDYLKDLNGEFVVDNILRFETIQNEFSSFCQSNFGRDILLPHIHIDAGKRSDKYREFHTKKTRNIIEKYFYEDLNRFNYSY